MRRTLRKFWRRRYFLLFQINFGEIFLWLKRLFVGVFLVLGLLVFFSIFKFSYDYQLLVVNSSSMKPAVKAGNLIVIKKEKDYRIGDIITFSTGLTSTTTHRVVEVKKATGSAEFVTKGDANKATDSATVKEKIVLGKMLLNVPYLGRPVSWTRTPQGLTFLVIIPATIIIYQEFLNLKKEILRIIKKKKQKKSLKI